MKMAVERGPQDPAGSEDRHLRRAWRPSGLDRLLPPDRPDLRFLLRPARADRPAGGGAGAAATSEAEGDWQGEDRGILRQISATDGGAGEDEAVEPVADPCTALFRIDRRTRKRVDARRGTRSDHRRLKHHRRRLEPDAATEAAFLIRRGYDGQTGVALARATAATRSSRHRDARHERLRRLAGDACVDVR